MGISYGTFKKMVMANYRAKRDKYYPSTGKITLAAHSLHEIKTDLLSAGASRFNISLYCLRFQKEHQTVKAEMAKHSICSSPEALRADLKFEVWSRNFHKRYYS